ncbi:MAG: DUF5696 domain-containing protein [Huintestinicola sp.]
MHTKLKRSIAFMMCLSMVLSTGAVSVFGDDEAAPEETSASDENEEKEEKQPRTEEEAMAEMTEVASNDKLAFYANTKEGLMALQDKNTGEIWWSNPVDAATSNAKAAQKKELQSTMTLVYAEPSKRSTTSANSKNKGSSKMKQQSNGVSIEYKFNDPDITVPVTITLEEDHLKLYVNTAEIVETYPSATSGMITTEVAFMTTFGAGRMDEEGYFVIPDGSGAVINFNNQKTGYRTYSAKVYGDDLTPVKNTKPVVSKNVSLPMYGIVKGNSGMVVVADKGDTAASIKSYVAGQNKTDYNSTYFSFELRTNDEYLMGGDSNPLKVFEKRGILVPEIELRYYPVSRDDGKDVDYTDIAETYRNYLIKEKGVVDKEIKENASLYLDVFGGTLKQESILGIPVTVKQSVTSYNQTKKMLTELTGLGVEDMVVTYNAWSNEDIGEKITDDFSPSGTLGGKKDLNSLMEYASQTGISLFPSVDNQQFKTGNGYWDMTNTSIRVSNAYSRILIYDLAHGVENQYYKPLALFTPASYDKAYSKLIKSYAKKGNGNIALGSLANSIYGDYGKKAVSREMAKGYVQDIYSNAKSQVGTVLADNANAYVIPYSDYISNVPISSSKFDLFDYDIPFYQMVMHGITPIGSTALNSEADIGEAVLLSIAAGTNLSFDFVGTEASELKDTKFDKYYYGYYRYWMDDAANFYRFSKDILSENADATITKYEIDGRKIRTEYSNGNVTLVDLDKKTVRAGNTTYKLADYVGKEVIGE